jgi:DNA-binding HxlR family transcriptional regulator
MQTMTSYGEYCPIAVGAEVIADRWTPLVLRELIIGCKRFNEIHRGIPKMNRTLLTQRLRALERRGLVERRTVDSANSVEYHLTAAGEDLAPVLWSLGQWAAQWAFGDPEDEQLDTAWLVWRMHQNVVDENLPDERTVVELVTTGAGGGRGWLVLDRGSSTACQMDPGYDVDLVVHGDNRELHRWLLGVTSFRKLQSTGALRLIGPSRLARAFPTWFDTGTYTESLRAGARRAR